MEIFRITKRKYAGDISGKGAELYGGRWNPIGVPALYTSENRALATLELLVHLPKELLPPSYVLLTIEIPTPLEEKIITIPENTLDTNWNSLQADTWTKEMGRYHFQDLKSLGIRVPSTIIPEEFNIILNPLHESFGKISVTTESNFQLDQRLFS